MNFQKYKHLKDNFKAVIEVTTEKDISVTAKIPITAETILTDLKKAAEDSKFLNESGEQINFSIKSSKEKNFIFSMDNFDGISFSDYIKPVSDSRKQVMKNWIKFWTNMSKLGYEIK